MARYVDADLIDLERVSDTICQQQAQDAIDDTPTADVVEVVRCKDCKWLVKSEGVCYLLSSYYEPPVYVEDDHYCSMGVRRGGGDK